MPRTIGRRVAPGIYWVRKGVYRVRVKATTRTGQQVSAEEQVRGKLADAEASRAVASVVRLVTRKGGRK